jgi:hypothetical protein
MPANQMPPDLLATRVYVVGEVLVSLVTLVGGFGLVFYSADDAVKLVGAGAISAVTGVWFIRRQAEHSANNLRSLASDELGQLRDQQSAQQASIEALVSLLARQRRDP